MPDLTIYKELVDFAKRYDVCILKVLDDDLYIYFEGYYNSPKERVIVKFYIPDISDQDNTYEVLQYLEDKGVQWAPKPILYTRIEEELKVNDSRGDSVYAMVVYTLVEGEILRDVKKRLQDNQVEKRKELCRCYTDMYKKLEQLHKLGLVAGLEDALPTRAIVRTEKEYTLTNFDRCFSVEHTPFRPMHYMFRDGYVPTADGDVKCLKEACGM